MVTQCTACQVWFKVTREQLHAAHGLVRCSACGTVFNALATLRHEMPETGKGPAASASPPRDTADTRAEANAQEPEPIPGQENAPEEPRAGDGPMEETVPARQPEDGEPDDPFQSVFEVLDRPPPEPWAGEGAAAEAGRSASPADDALPPLLESLAPPSGRASEAVRRWLWTAALVLALLALLAQIVYARRNSLAALFGVTLGQHIALGRYGITDASLDADPRQPGALVLSGTLSNHAGRSQPAPLIRVTLTDRYGQTVGARMLTPTEYGAQANTPIKAHQRFMFHVKLADPGASAVGFSLVLCKHRDGSVWCQDD